MSNILNGLRLTAQRKLVYDFLLAQTQSKSAEEIFESLPAKSVDLSTVYRILDSFFHVMLVSRNYVNQRMHYLLTSKQHLHYLICLDCRDTIAIEFCPYQDFDKIIEENAHFHIKYHPLEIYGYCEKCQDNHSNESNSSIHNH